jgi:hypothetical protein
MKEYKLVIGEHPELGRVTLEMEITHHGQEFTTTGDPIVKKSVNLEDVTEYDELTISGTSRNGGGQINDSIREHLDGFKKLYVPRDSVVRILDIWDAHHLGGLNAGTRKQKAAVDAYLKQTGKRYDYADVAQYLETMGFSPENGYKYGTAWLVSPLPEPVKAEILALFSPESEQPTEPAEGSLDAFITKHNLRFSCRRVDSRPDGASGIAALNPATRTPSQKSRKR